MAPELVRSTTLEVQHGNLIVCGFFEVSKVGKYLVELGRQGQNPEDGYLSPQRQYISPMMDASG